MALGEADVTTVGAVQHCGRDREQEQIVRSIERNDGGDQTDARVGDLADHPQADDVGEWQWTGPTRQADGGGDEQGR